MRTPSMASQPCSGCDAPPLRLVAVNAMTVKMITASTMIVATARPRHDRKVA